MMSEDTRRFRSISSREAQIIWSICKRSSSGRWSGITQAIEEIRKVRGGRSITRQTAYDFLKAHPDPEPVPDYLGRKDSRRTSKTPDELIESAIIPVDTENRDGRIEQQIANMLYVILHRLWKDYTLLLGAGGRYSAKERIASFWISWANPSPLFEEDGWRGPTMFPDMNRRNERSIHLKRVIQERERLIVSFEIAWEGP